MNRAIEILGQDSERKFHEVLAARALGTAHPKEDEGRKDAQAAAREKRLKRLAIIGVTAAVALGVAYVVYKLNQN